MPIQLTPVVSAIGAAPASASAGGSGTSKETAEKIQKAATDFEAILIGQMLKSARESGGGMTGDLEEQDETNSTMVELGEQQMAQALASSGGLGIAKMVITGLTKHANR